MIRFTWRQFRTQALVVFGDLAVVAIVLAITGPHLVHLYNTTVATCGAHGDCSAADSAFLKNDRNLQIALEALVVVVPGIIGIFWGAPLVAGELETGTFRLAWTQGVTRTRWLAVKLGAVGLASTAVAGLLSLMVTWWSSPVDRVNMSNFVSFDYRDIVPIGYAALAFALGATAGVLLRRTLPAMATTLVTFVLARVALTHWVRPHLITPVHLDLALNPASTGYGSYSTLFSSSGGNTLQPSTPTIPNAWITATQIEDKAGRGLTTQYLRSACPKLGGNGGPGGGGRGGAGGSHQTSRVSAGAQQVLQDCVAKVGKTFHGGGGVSARQPVLGFPMVRAGDLPRCCPPSGRFLPLVGPPPPLLRRSAEPKRHPPTSNTSKVG
jgi:hypothetical protein